MKRLVVSEQVFESMYADYVRRAIGKGVVTFLEYKRAFMRSTGFAVGNAEHSGIRP